MSIYAGFYIILSSVYTFSYAKQIWQKNKAASLGSVLLVFSQWAQRFLYI